jgi:hypothetical protein
VTVLLHDVDREVEQRIISSMFSLEDPALRQLGIVHGKAGHLAAFQMGRP